MQSRAFVNNSARIGVWTASTDETANHWLRHADNCNTRADSTRYPIINPHTQVEKAARWGGRCLFKRRATHYGPRPTNNLPASTRVTPRLDRPEGIAYPVPSERPSASQSNQPPGNSAPHTHPINHNTTTTAAAVMSSRLTKRRSRSKATHSGLLCSRARCCTCHAPFEAKDTRFTAVKTDRSGTHRLVLPNPTAVATASRAIPCACSLCRDAAPLLQSSPLRVDWHTPLQLQRRQDEDPQPAPPTSPP